MNDMMFNLCPTCGMMSYNIDDSIVDKPYIMTQNNCRECGKK